MGTRRRWVRALPMGVALLVVAAGCSTTERPPESRSRDRGTAGPSTAVPPVPTVVRTPGDALGAGEVVFDLAFAVESRTDFERNVQADLERAFAEFAAPAGMRILTIFDASERVDDIEGAEAWTWDGVALTSPTSILTGPASLYMAQVFATGDLLSGTPPIARAVSWRIESFDGGATYALSPHEDEQRLRATRTDAFVVACYDEQLEGRPFWGDGEVGTRDAPKTPAATSIDGLPIEEVSGVVLVINARDPRHNGFVEPPDELRSGWYVTEQLNGRYDHHWWPMLSGTEVYVGVGDNFGGRTLVTMGDGLAVNASLMPSIGKRVERIVESSGEILPSDEVIIADTAAGPIRLGTVDFVQRQRTVTIVNTGTTDVVTVDRFRLEPGDAMDLYLGPDGFLRLP